eukprot:14161-Heterococcus_DN1.PRE.4
MDEDGGQSGVYRFVPFTEPDISWQAELQSDVLGDYIIENNAAEDALGPSGSDIDMDTLGALMPVTQAPAHLAQLFNPDRFSGHLPAGTGEPRFDCRGSSSALSVRGCALTLASLLFLAFTGCECTCAHNSTVESTLCDFLSLNSRDRHPDDGILNKCSVHTVYCSLCTVDWSASLCLHWSSACVCTQKDQLQRQWATYRKDCSKQNAGELSALVKGAAFPVVEQFTSLCDSVLQSEAMQHASNMLRLQPLVVLLIEPSHEAVRRLFAQMVADDESIVVSIYGMQPVNPAAVYAKRQTQLLEEYKARFHATLKDVTVAPIQAVVTTLSSIDLNRLYWCLAKPFLSLYHKHIATTQGSPQFVEPVSRAFSDLHPHEQGTLYYLTGWLLLKIIDKRNRLSASKSTVGAALVEQCFSQELVSNSQHSSVDEADTACMPVSQIVRLNKGGLQCSTEPLF